VTQRHPVVLIVEDDAWSQRLMQDVLEHEGYDVVVTDKAETGIELIRALSPSLVLMDICLPGISGFEAIRAIRADGRIARTCVIAVTAAALGAESRFESAGFDGFQPKPLVLQEFLGTIRRLVQT